MPDILSQGREREPGSGQHGPRPWRRLALAGVAVAVLAALVVTRLPGHIRPPFRAYSPPAAGWLRVRDRCRSACRAGRADRADRGLGREPAAAAGRVAARLVLSVLGAPRADRRPAGQPDRVRVSRAVGGWAVQAAPPAGTDGQLGCAACASPPLPVWFLADGASRATRAGRANLVAPGARRGTLWLTSYPARRHCGARRRPGWRWPGSPRCGSAPCRAPRSAATRWPGSGWPDGQDRLVAELSFTTKVQVAAWKPGAPAAGRSPGPARPPPRLSRHRLIGWCHQLVCGVTSQLAGARIGKGTPYRRSNPGLGYHPNGLETS